MSTRQKRSTIGERSTSCWHRSLSPQRESAEQRSMLIEVSHKNSVMTPSGASSPDSIIPDVAPGPVVPDWQALLTDRDLLSALIEVMAALRDHPVVTFKDQHNDRKAVQAVVHQLSGVCKAWRYESKVYHLNWECTQRTGLYAYHHPSVRAITRLQKQRFLEVLPSNAVTPLVLTTWPPDVSRAACLSSTRR